jgi:hypothetical protein
MITKKELIELVRHRVNGEFQAKQLGKVGDQMLAYYIGRAFNQMLIEVFRRNLANFDPYTKEYTGIAISQDETTNVYYSTLPAPVVQLPRIGDGVLQVSGDTSASLEFVPITNNCLQVKDGLDVDTIDDVVGYCFKNGRIEYQGITNTIAEGTVRMLLVIPFEEYLEDDYVQIPTGTDEALIRSVIDLLIGTPDADRANNANSLNKNMIQ